MAHAHARDILRHPHTQLTAVADIDLPRAQAFAAKFGAPFACTDQADLFDHVDALVNATPDAFHAPLTLRALAAGKHVLCEKPLATNPADARRMARAAAKHRVVNLVNFSYRNSSALQRAHALIARGDLGRPLHFEASYLQSWLSSTVWGDWKTSDAWLWRLSTRHGSLGVLGDIGVHILDFAAFPLGPFASVNCHLHTFDKAPGGNIGPYTLDANDSAVIHASMQNGAVGVIHTTRWATGHKNSLSLRIFGDLGALRIELDQGFDRLDICLGRQRHRAEWKTVTCSPTPTNFDRFVRAIRTGNPQPPDFAHGAAIQTVIDACFRSHRTGKTIPIR